ncbi:hypothetical protein [Thermomonospora cellulosilytica]|uniref:Uncharacterized protein n=1 Tax=Thermomonospora cellulosilytica TaxID=1411118 RepID=A0A7W3MV02_9ACTN|nr:hypothetical protein [Thermomonospora cellulosilytica]MBA9002332.1 hypothetical protein [Thermomonospora cellulosilytica]
MSLRDHLWQAGERALDAIPEKLRADIYVVSFRISHGEHSIRIDDFDYPYDPYLAIGYNTEDHFQRMADETSVDAAEARWSYAYMLLEEAPPIGHHPDDSAGTDLYLAEVRSLGLWYDHTGDLSEEEIAERGQALADHFDDLVIDLARHLHDSGRIEKVFGRRIPVVVFDMFRPIEGEATRAANPPELITDYLAYYREAEGVTEDR